MTREDLMVGNWVMLYRDIPTKVDCIGNIEVYLTDKLGVDWKVTYEHITPIPLTPEILEKNGFVFSSGRGTRKSHQANFDGAYVSLWKRRLTLRTRPVFGKVANRVHADCVYVHELQQALRLAGITKEIVM